MSSKRLWSAPCLLGIAFGLALSPLSAQTSPSTTGPTVAEAAPPYPRGAETLLGGQIAAALAGPEVSRAHWGIAVTALDGTPLYGLDEGKLFRPASTAKLFTTAAGMALLGPEKTWTTTVHGDLDPATGTVKGDLVLVGAGDPDFGTTDVPYIPPGQRAKAAGPAKPPVLADLEELADKLAARGVKQVTGSVVGDDTLFPYEPYAEGWNQDDAVWGYGAPVSALSIADNQLTLTVTPGQITGSPGHETATPAGATLEQYGLPYYNVMRPLDTLPQTGPPSAVQVDRAPGSHTVRVYGWVRAGSPADVEHVAIADPAAFAAMALRQMLVARGIGVHGEARAQHIEPFDAHDFLSTLRQPHSCEERIMQGGQCGGDCMTGTQPNAVLASHTSPSLAQDVIVTAKTSQNLHAELLLHQLGRLAFCAQGSTLAGVHMVRAFAQHAGITADDFMLYDGSGLSVKDLVTPRAEAQLLAYAAKQPWFAQWKAALPVGGVDGTLGGRFKEAPLKGHVFAKTGTLGESRALAGYVECASGQTVIVSVLVDNHLPGTSADREAMDRIVAAVVASYWERRCELECAADGIRDPWLRSG